MKKRSNITLLIILLLLLSIPVAGYYYLRHLATEAEKNPFNKGLNEIRLNPNNRDSVELNLNSNGAHGFQIETAIKHTK